MEIVFGTRKLERACNSERECIRCWGADNAKKIMQRLQELRAAPALTDMSALPAARCHPLGGRKVGEFAVDLKDPFRLVFEPAHRPVPRKQDGGIDLDRVTRIRVLRVEDYHGR